MYRILTIPLMMMMIYIEFPLNCMQMALLDKHGEITRMRNVEVMYVLDYDAIPTLLLGAQSFHYCAVATTGIGNAPTLSTRDSVHHCLSDGVLWLVLSQLQLLPVLAIAGAVISRAEHVAKTYIICSLAQLK